MSNKYNSLRETLTSDPIFNALLSTKATPPADLSLTNVDFTSKYCYGQTDVAGDALVKFAINDHPRIIGVGIFCNMADGLVQITNETFQFGLGLSFSLHQFNAANVDQGVLTSLFAFKVAELNQIFETDVLLDVSGVDTTLDSLRLQASWGTDGVDFSTISVNPDFAAKRLTFRPVVVVEHTFEMTSP